MNLVILSTIALLAVFTLVGLGVTFNAYRVGHQDRKKSEAGVPAAELRERVRRYVGPVDPKTALLNPVGRVAVEFVGGFCGFPGLGWLCSGSVVTGLLLICCVPAFAWGFYPVLLALMNKLASSPYIVIEYLPGIGVASAAALSYREIMLSRKRQRDARASATAQQSTATREGGLPS